MSGCHTRVPRASSGQILSSGWSDFNSMAETASNSSTSSIPLWQTAVESPPRPEPLSYVPDSGPPDKLGAILQHLKHLAEEIEEVKKSQRQGQMGESGHLFSPHRRGYVPPTSDV